MGATMSDRGWQVWIRSGCYSRTWHRLWPQSWKLQLMSILVGEFPFKSHFKLVKLFWLKWTTRNRLPCSFSLKLMLRKLVEIGAAWLGSLAFQKGPEVFSDQGRIWVFAKRSRFQPINYFHRSGETILCVILHVFWSLLKSSEVFRFLFNIYIYIYIYISHCSYCYWRNSYSWLCQCDCSPRRQWQPHLGGCQSTGFAACKKLRFHWRNYRMRWLRWIFV